MWTNRDFEKGDLDKETQALLEARNEGRPDDGEHPTQVDNIELVVFRKPGLSSSNIANDEQPNEIEKSNVSEETNESEDPKDEPKTPNANIQIPLPPPTWNINTSLLVAIANNNNEEVSRLLKNGANPNATYLKNLMSACHIAAFFNKEALRMLIEAKVERRRHDVNGLTPLHYAAMTNAPETIAMILGFPEDLTNEVAKANCALTPEQEAEIKQIGSRVHSLVDATLTVVENRTGEGSPGDWTLPDEWKCGWENDREHSDVQEQYTAYRKRAVSNLRRLLEAGSSALHAASVAAHPQCVRLLLAAGADPNLRTNKTNSTPLDVAGASSYANMQSYVETLEILRKYGGKLSSVESRVLERALGKRSLQSLQALTLLLDAGATINHRSPSDNESDTEAQISCINNFQVLLNYNSPEMDYRAVDVTDETGSTVLHWAVCEGWPDGVTVALLAGADITHENVNGNTALHLAAKTGYYDIVKQILDHDTKRQCDLSKENKKGDSPFSNAILSGNADIVRLMLDLDDNLRDHFDRKVRELTPLIYAAENKFLDLFILIVDERLKFLNEDEMIDVLNFIAEHNLWELFLRIEYKYNDIVKSFALCEAIKHNSREMILVLLEKGADLSQQNADGQTAISLLMSHVPKPTEFMTELLDQCIKTNKNIYDKDCVITINYSLLKPFIYEGLKPTNDMRVLEALIETGDVYNQRSLLTHPVVESFLYLKWKKCAKFIYFLLIVYLLFLISLNTFIGTIYYHMDHKIKEQDIISVFNPIVWRFSAAFTLCLSFLVNLFFWTSSTKKWYCNKTIWIKLFTITGGVIMIFISMDAANTDIIRGVAVVTVSLSWLCLMMYLSWTPTLGYYMQMYGKVSKNVIKVLLSFSLPLVSFSICFMILLRSKVPFDSPVAAFLKTMVMMSSEFEYENLVENTITDSPEDVKNSTFSSPDKDEPLISLYMLRIFFLLFFVCVAIVLMNLMLGVAVSDIQELSRDGKQRRLMKQVECISMLEKLFKRKPLSMYRMNAAVDVLTKVKVRLNSKIFGREMRENIMNKAQSLKETEEKKADDDSMKTKIDDIFDLSKNISEILGIKLKLNTKMKITRLKSEKGIFRPCEL